MMPIAKMIQTEMTLHGWPTIAFDSLENIDQ